MPAVTGPVQEAQGGATNLTFSGSFTVTFPSNVAAGDSVLIAIACGAVATEFDPTPSGLGGTWTRLQQLNNNTTGVLDLWLCTGANGSTKIITVTVGTGTTEDVAAIASEWGPLEVAGVVNGTLHGSAGSSPTTTATVSVTPDTGRRYQLVVAYAMTDDSASAGPTINNSPTTFTSFTGRTQDTVRVAGGYIKLNPPSGSYGTTWNIPTAGQHYNAITVAVYAAPLAAVNGAGTITAADSSVSANGTNVIPDNPLPLELRIYDATDPLGAAIAAVEGYRGLELVDQYNALGSGRFEIAASDAKATTANLAKYNLCRCFLGPFDVFQFWIETPAYQVASANGPADERITVAGRGLEQYIARARVAGASTYTAQTAGAVMLAEIGLAQVRGTISLLKMDFSATIDSAGNAWSGSLATVTLALTVGTSLLDVLNTLRSLGVYARMRNDFTLQMWTADPGRDQTSSVILRQGKHLRDTTRWTEPERQAANVMFARSDSGSVQVTIGGTGLPDQFEGYVEGPSGSDNTTLTQLATSEAARRLDESTAIAVPVNHGLGAGEYEPYRHYVPGDSVALDVPGWFSKASERVAGIHLKSDDSGYYGVELDLSSVQPDVLLTIIKQVAALSVPT